VVTSLPKRDIGNSVSAMAMLRQQPHSFRIADNQE